jgi:hypothetical protein
MPQDFFTTLGKSVAAEMAQPSGHYSAPQRAKLSKVMRGVLNNHLSGPLAQDAMPTSLGRVVQRNAARDQETDPTLAPRGGYNTAPGDLVDPADALLIVRQLLDGLPPNQRDAFAGQLMEIVETTPTDDVLENNPQATDGRSRRRRVSRDNQMPAPAQDAAMRRSFEQRFPFTSHVDVWGVR